MKLKTILLTIMVSLLSLSGMAQNNFNPKDIVGKWRLIKLVLSVAPENGEIIEGVLVDNERIIYTFGSNGSYSTNHGTKGNYSIKGDKIILKLSDGTVYDNYILQLTDKRMSQTFGVDGVLTTDDLLYLRSNPGFDKSKLEAIKKLIGKKVTLISNTYYEKM